MTLGTSPRLRPVAKLNGAEQGNNPLKRTASTVLILLVGIFIGRYVVPATISGESPVFEIVSSQQGQRQFAFPTFWEAWDALHENYISSLDDKNLFYGAVAGMVRATGDPYTVFSTPEDAKQFQETLSGQFSGVGIEIGVEGGLVKVIAPLAGSPAEQAGVLAGDIIIGVDDTAITPDMTLDEVVQKIRGPLGSTVVLKVVHQGEDEPVDISVRRDTIQIESVRSSVENGIAHISLLSFNGDTTDQFASISRQLQQQNIQGIILDVRNNPGGFLQTSVDIASFFLEQGTEVVSEEGRKEGKEVYKTKGRPILADIPLVILVNEGSASASEILAGALADQRGVPIIGTKTFGKGSVQELITLKDGSSIRVTVAKWFTPSGRSIDDEGIAPTIEVKDNRDTEEDEVLQRALEELK